jgi:hypothetical protein
MALKADFRLALSGTPIENHLGELWSLFRFLNPGLLGRVKSFNQRFAAPIEHDGMAYPVRWPWRHDLLACGKEIHLHLLPAQALFLF